MEHQSMHDLGLHADLQMWQQAPVNRRRFIRMGLAGIALLLAGCLPDDAEDGEVIGATAVPNTPTSAPLLATDVSDTAVVDSCVDTIPPESAGPFPADGSRASGQDLNVLALSGIVRQDIRTSLGTGTTAKGVPLAMELTLVNTNNNCAPLAGYAMYIWHCDAEGNYSLYSNAAVEEDYLRGVQVADSSGKLTFNSIYPGCYPGRWPHAHFEIYPSLEQATDASNVILTSQLALPENASQNVYTESAYPQSAQFLSQLSLTSDVVFRDGADLQMASVSGDAVNGYVAHLTIGIAA